MGRCCFSFVASWAVAVVLLSNATMKAQEPAGGGRLIEFKSEAGKFSILLPGQPEHEVVEVGADQGKQHQYKTGTDRGVFLVSYQDNPNLAGATPEQMTLALESGRDRLEKVFGGKLLENQRITFDETHPGLSFRVSIPQAKGEARCRFYMVGTRLYQIMAIGVPEFANSGEASEVIDSFTLLR